MRQKQMGIALTWQFLTCGFYQASVFVFMDIEFDYPSFYCVAFELSWHLHSQSTIFMSNEQSSSGPHVSLTGHLIGHSACLSLLQKKVINISVIGYCKSILNNCGA
jgi:hypothetical protein